MVGKKMQKVSDTTSIKWLSQLVLFISISLSHVVASAQAIDGDEYENWTVRCEKSDGRESCFIFQNLVLQEGGNSILHVAVGYLPGKKDVPVILVSMPLGISLPPGAAIKIDEHDAVKFAIERCETSGCRGGFKLDNEMLSRFKKGNTATVTFHDGHRQPIEMPLSLIGFSAGINALGL